LIKNIEVYYGVVEDDMDPDELDRYRVRIHGLHTPDKSLIPTTSLHWSRVLLSGVHGSAKGRGFTATGLVIGDTVMGFFLDGTSKQDFIIIGTYIGITTGENDSNIIGRAKGNEHETVITKKAQLKGTHIDTSYDQCIYPDLQVYESRTGHIIIVDDTKDEERIEVIHRSGSGFELIEDGSFQIITQVQNNSINNGELNRITVKNENIQVGGDVNVEIDGNWNVTVGGEIHFWAKGNIYFNGKNIYENCKVSKPNPIINTVRR